MVEVYKPSRTQVLQESVNDAISATVHDIRKFALLDFPDHDNVGDSAIYCGEVDFFRRHGVKPAYCSTTSNYSQENMKSAIGDGPIFLHGGGNFGTIWPWYQDFREGVLHKNRGRKIVQLPQTLFYDSQNKLDESARAIERHGNFTLLVRDRKSYDLACSKFQCEIALCPDMAIMMDPIERLPASKEILLHLRGDKEAADQYDTSALTSGGATVRFDWPTEGPDFHAEVRRSILPALGLAGLRGGRQGYRERRYRGLAECRLRRGIELLSRGEKVVTNRLHGHILCYLMDIPHCVIDNSYGKTSSFMDAWGTGGGSNVYRADTVEEAVALLG